MVRLLPKVRCGKLSCLSATAARPPTLVHRFPC